jgi:hypothetical protein
VHLIAYVQCRIHGWNQKINLLQVRRRNQCVKQHHFCNISRELNYFVVSPITLLYYDYILTFNTEVLRIWSPLRCNWGTVLFLLNRYVVIFGYIPIVAELFIPNSKEKQCYIIQTYHQCLSIIIQGIVTGMSTWFSVYSLLTSYPPLAIMIVRVHALWERSRAILAITLVFSVISIAFGLVSIFVCRSGFLSKSD